MWKHGLTLRANLQKAVLPLAIGLGSLNCLHFWMKWNGRLPALYDLKTDQFLHVLDAPYALPARLAFYCWNALLYVGLFLAPLTIWCQGVKNQEIRRRVSIISFLAVFVFSLATLIRLTTKHSLMPLVGNIIVPEGIGPLTLRDVAFLSLSHVPALPRGFWLCVTMMSLLGANLLIHRFTRFIITGAPWGALFTRLRSSTVFLSICSVAYLGPLLLTGFFDRYLVPSLVFLIPLVVAEVGSVPQRRRRSRAFSAIVLTCFFGIYAVIGTRDYLAWNRARWLALGDSALSEVKPDAIDGGFEFNGWYQYTARHSAEAVAESDRWAAGHRFLIAFGETQGYDVVTEYNYVHWMPFYQGRILLLKRPAIESSGTLDQRSNATQH